MSEIEQININTADVETLTQLPGIGQAVAEKIIQYRENVHPFEEIIELAAVPGISERMVRKFEPLLTVGDVVSEVVEDEPEAAEEAEAELVVFEAVESDAPAAEEEAVEPVAAVVEEEAEAEEIATPVAIAVEEPPAAPAPNPTPAPAFTRPAAPAYTPPPPAAAPRVYSQPPAAAPRVYSQPPAPASSGLNWGSVLLGAALGALLSIALMMLFANVLGFARVSDVQAQLEAARSSAATKSELETVTTTLNNLTTNLDALQNDLSDTKNQMSEDLNSATQRIDKVEATQGTLSEALVTTQGDVTTLQDSNVVLSERVDGVADAAESFDSFLTNMRDLLINLQGMPEPTAPVTDTQSIDPSPTVTVPLTDTKGTATPIPTPTVEAGENSGTATPRPSPTPIITPTPKP